MWTLLPGKLTLHCENGSYSTHSVPTYILGIVETQFELKISVFERVSEGIQLVEVRTLRH